MQKVSEWLNDIGTHSILDCEAAKEDFEKETGDVAPWSSGYSRKQMIGQIEARGKGGQLSDEDDGKRLIDSLSVAYACYGRYSGNETAESKFGMGSQVREYVQAIIRNGK